MSDIKLEQRETFVGTEEVSYLVPNRFEYGYGLTSELISAAVKQGLSADLIITVDNGISNHEGVAAANGTGADVIITDHHLPGSSLPDAYAIVNPNLADDAFPSKALAGVGVMFYVLVALRQELGSRCGPARSQQSNSSRAGFKTDSFW